MTEAKFLFSVADTIVLPGPLHSAVIRLSTCARACAVVVGVGAVLVCVHVELAGGAQLSWV